MVVSPDVGGVIRARAIAKRIPGADLAIIDKRRPQPNEAQVMHIIGEVKDRIVLLSMISSILPAPYAMPLKP